jgi:hypothetical protein
LIPKKDNIDIFYIKRKLERVLRVIARGRRGEQGEDEFTKVYPSMIENIEITMLIDKEGNFDVLIAQRYQFLDDIKRKADEYQNQIRKISIEMELEYEFEEKKLSEFFDIIRGKQIYSNDYIRKHKGNIPVYSSQTINDGIIGYIDTFDFDCNALGTVSKDRQKGKNRIKRRRGGGKKWEGINDYTQ